MVRRNLFLRVGILQAAALAPPQSGKAAAIRIRLRALRYGRGHARRHHRSQESKAQHLRNGPQVALECPTRRSASRKLFSKSRSFIKRRSREAGWRIRHLGSNRRDAFSILGGETWA